MPTITVETVAAATAEVRALIDELDESFAIHYLAEQRHGLAVAALFEPHMRFFIARLDGAAMGCAGVAIFATFAEVKRMYVRDRARGQGIARALLSRIQTEASNNGRDVLRLETGRSQHAAIRLYERAGFRNCEAFGAYAVLEPQAVATSVFFEKRLERSSRSSSAERIDGDAIL